MKHVISLVGFIKNVKMFKQEHFTKEIESKPYWMNKSIVYRMQMR